MTHPGDDSADAAPGPADGPVHAADGFSLIVAGVRAMRRRPAEVAVLWAASAALVFASQAVRRAGGPALVFPGLSPAWLGFEVLNIVPNALLGTLALRLFLGGRAWRAPDRGFWTCAGLLIAAALAPVVVSQLAMAPAVFGGPAPMIFLPLLVFGGTVVLWWLYARLLLWPIGALAGNPDMTARRSWDRMNGYVTGFAVAVIAINLPMTLATFGYSFTHRAAILGRPEQLPLVLGIATVLVGAPVQLLQRAMAAVLYGALTTSTRLSGASTKR
jgi:hypothetical protein